ncbi:hypothetical protein GCM10009304_13810 [Pseudomonas matsuisoli]|uniref:Uncharacterized protein n=1 Tax=Pseudomonas matsuisoli TaxID=1515666 RepID=A0A917PRQ4_9PSED|nr:hypothetical protein GCM10009304_13810 [Pseudomonas matsuisoli]
MLACIYGLGPTNASAMFALAGYFASDRPEENKRDERYNLIAKYWQIHRAWEAVMANSKVLTAK